MEKTKIISELINLYDTNEKLKAENKALKEGTLVESVLDKNGINVRTKKFESKIQSLGKIALAEQLCDGTLEYYCDKDYNTLNKNEDGILSYEDWKTKLLLVGKDLFVDTLYLEEFSEEELIEYFDEYFKSNYEKRVRRDKDSLKGDN